MNRAYSLLDIRAVDEDARVITGIATTPSPDRMEDVVLPEGAKFKLPIPLLWQHDAKSPIGNVTRAKVTKDGIEVIAEIGKGIHAEIDRAWSLIKAGYVRGLSIGFRGLEEEPIKGTFGRIFKTWEWLELSAVTIPANAEATIQTVKQFSQNSAEVETAATGKKSRQVSLNAPARDGAKPFIPIIRSRTNVQIRRTDHGVGS